ncbi:polymerase delta-interacting protein 3 isoform X2 [Oncorhynchus tshawytscha]|uniref:polymerase delta-interacting protein 3 isoform X2 n=1 Tax=Oncorhynchus tshawytscha TaxID=74940 RepID=UPI000D09E480|nr:polymerase delta-interacting protein 3 isoform X2 [Oncorhynchus tshawytscha]
MEDISLDEVIRRRGFNNKETIKRPMFGRGAGGVGRTFDARQKIGMTDVRQRLGGGGGTAFQVKDAREKLGQKDARFRIRGGGGAGGVQDARQMINSRKGGPNTFNVTPQSLQQIPAAQLQTHVQQIQIHTSNDIASANARQFTPNLQGMNIRAGVTPQLGGAPKRMMDARDRLSLKRTIGAPPSQGMVAPMKITKTIQQRPVGMSSGIRMKMPSRGSQSFSGDDDIPSKQMKTTTGNHMLQSRPGTLGCPFTMSAPITKVVKNDAYTAPRPPVPVAPTRPNPSVGASRSSALALQPISRTLRQAGPTAEPNSQPPPPPQESHILDCTGPLTSLVGSIASLGPTFSPLEGTKITVNNLHPRVTEEDIVELFCVCGALKRARLVKVGIAEVVFVRKEDAVSAYRKYNNRCLDGQPMKCNLHIQGNIITSDQPILLRLSDTPGTGRKEGLPLSLSRPGGRPASSQPTPEVDPQTILKALFKSTVQTPSTTESPGSQCTAFRIKI